MESRGKLERSKLIFRRCLTRYKPSNNGGSSLKQTLKLNVARRV